MKSGYTRREIPPVPAEDFFLLQDHPEARFDYPVHYHTAYELNLVLNTQGKRIVGSSLENYKGRDLVLVGSELLHAWNSSDREAKTRVVTLQFPADFLPDKILRREVMNPIRELLKRSHCGIVFEGKPADMLAKQLIHLKSLNGFESYLGFMSLLNNLATAPGQRMLNDPYLIQKTRQKGKERILPAYDYIRKHYRKKVRLADVAGLIHMTPSAFSHYFKKCTCRSFADFVTDLRIMEACKLLIETDDPVGVIAGNCGFNNLTNFNRLFKKRKLLTPREYYTKVHSR